MVEMHKKATDGVVGAFVLAARVAIREEVALPVIVDFHMDVVMNDTVREGGGMVAGVPPSFVTVVEQDVVVVVLLKSF